MAKVTLGPKTLLYPLPAFLVGAVVDGKPNFMTAAWSGVVNSQPPMVSVSLQHHRHTMAGIKENGTFSVNVPSAEMVRETDYCGMVSGATTDKVADCKFTIFYGSLKTAPMIERCPLNLECRVVHTLNLGSHLMVIGQVEETYVSETCLTNGQPDADKIRPIAWAIGAGGAYRELGQRIGAAFSAGKDLKG